MDGAQFQRLKDINQGGNCIGVLAYTDLSGCAIARPVVVRFLSCKPAIVVQTATTTPKVAALQSNPKCSIWIGQFMGKEALLRGSVSFHANDGRYQEAFDEIWKDGIPWFTGPKDETRLILEMHSSAAEICDACSCEKVTFD